MKHKMAEMLLDGVEDHFLAEAAAYTAIRTASKKRWIAVAACLALCCTVGVSAYANGLLEPLLEYISGDPIPTAETHGQTVTDGQVTLRLERALCDDHVGRAIVSFLGLPEEAQNLDIQEQFVLYGITAKGEKTDVRSWKSGTYTAHSCKAEAVTHYPDADMTFVLTWQPADGLEGMDRLGFAYGDLTLEWETGSVRLPEYTLQAADPAESRASPVLSGLGVYVETSDPYFGGRILLCYSDGRTVEAPYSASLDIDRYAALWGEQFGIGYYDPTELSGISIDGVEYIFAE